MRLELDNDYRVGSVPLNFTLEERNIRKSENKETGEIDEIEEWRIVGYFSALSQLLNSYLTKSLINTTATGCEKIIDEIRRVERVIESIPKIALEREKE